MGTFLVFWQTGTDLGGVWWRRLCGAGGRAFRGSTPSATEWSAARRKPLLAAAMHQGAANLADEQARRLPTSDRQKLPSANFRSARDFEGAEGVDPRKARAPPQLRPRFPAIEECPHFSHAGSHGGR